MDIFGIEAGNGAHIAKLGAEGSIAVERRISHVILNDGEIHIAGFHQTHVFSRSAGGLGGNGKRAVALVAQHLADGAAQGEIDAGGSSRGQGKPFGISGKRRGGGEDQGAGQKKAQHVFHQRFSLKNDFPQWTPASRAARRRNIYGKG